MKLIEALIEQLDGVSAAQGTITVFTLKKADATAVYNLLSSVFGRSTTTGAFGGGGGAFGGGTLGGATAAQGTGRPLLSLGGEDISPGATLLDLRITPDLRTNSLVVAGSQTDIDTIEAIIAKLESIPTESVQNTEVIKIHNASVADINTAIGAYLTGLNGIIGNAASASGLTSGLYAPLAYFLTAEPVTNQLIVGGSPQIIAKIRDLVAQLDVGPPQVYIQVLVAEVTLTNNSEFGIEVGLQNPLMFVRSLTGGTGTAPGTPGYNFNTTAALPNNSIDNGKIAYQGLGNLGVGRAGANGGPGGFIFSAASDTVSVLVRALQVQGRAEILSAPQLLLLDNQVGYFQDGQDVPYLGGSTLSTTGTQQDVLYRSVGVKLRVTPRINPDGKVIMRIEPEVSSIQPGQVNLGPGVNSPVFNLKTVQTTIQASDGETVVLGGLIRKTDTKSENKIPWFGDLPYVGSLFRYRQHDMERRETIFIVTPHVLRTEADRARVSAEMALKMNYNVKDVIAIQGHGADVLSGRNPFAPAPESQQPWCPPQGGGYYVPGFYYPQGDPAAPAPAPAPGTPAPAGQPAPQPMTPNGQQQPMPGGNPQQPMVPNGQQQPMPGGNPPMQSMAPVQPLAQQGYPAVAPIQPLVPQSYPVPTAAAPPATFTPAAGPGLVPVGGYWYPAPAPGPVMYPGRPYPAPAQTPAPPSNPGAKKASSSDRPAMESSQWSVFDIK
jgi:type II secretory pathway component GspD/PulD (secretin)